MKALLFLSIALTHNTLVEATEVGPNFDPENANAWETEYGEYPFRAYQSFDLTSPQIRKIVESPACIDDHRYTFLTPRGYKVPEPGNLILNNNGDLVWAQSTGEQSYDLRTQDYLGKRYLSYWTGDDAIRGHGEGQYHMVGIEFW